MKREKKEREKGKRKIIKERNSYVEPRGVREKEKEREREILRQYLVVYYIKSKIYYEGSEERKEKGMEKEVRENLN